MTDELPVRLTRARLSDATHERSCFVEERDEQELVLIAPGDTLRPPQEHSPMTLYWAGDRGQYQVPVEFVKLEHHEQVRLYRVRATGAVELSQRRRFVRVPCREKVELFSLAFAGSREGQLIDISEGGARCAFPADYVAAGDAIELEFDLDGELVVMGSVLRVFPGKQGGTEVVLTFDTTDTIANQIRRYIFAQQLATRRSRGS